MDEQFAKVKTGGGGLRLKGEKVILWRFQFSVFFGQILKAWYGLHSVQLTVLSGKEAEEAQEKQKERA